MYFKTDFSYRWTHISPAATADPSLISHQSLNTVTERQGRKQRTSGTAAGLARLNAPLLQCVPTGKVCVAQPLR